MKQLSFRMKVGAGLFVATAAMVVAASGCELIAQVDRSKIVEGTGGTGGSTTTTGGGGVAPMCTTLNVADKCGKDSTCRKFTCPSGSCVTTDAMKGTTCTEEMGEECDGMGKCVKKHCNNDKLDADESDKDCGGKDCAGCANTKKCNKNDDCDSGYCQAGMMGTGGAGGGTAMGGMGGMMAMGGTCQPCGVDANCNGDKWCNTTTKKCEADQAPGMGKTCTADTQCKDNKDCVDGFCCDGPCSAACSACSKAKGATDEGKCAAAAVKSADDAGSCDDTKGMCDGNKKCTCDALGACKVKNGEAMADADKAKCASGKVADVVAGNGICCNSDCAGACETCKKSLGADTDGTCKTAGVKSADDDNCNDTKGMCDGAKKCKCNAAGACKVKLGEAAPPDKTKCVSGETADGVCCNSACTDGCSKCDATGTCKANDVKSAEDDKCNDTNAFGDCAAGKKCTCNSSGLCKVKTGEPETTASKCNSTFSSDGFCCAEACTGACSSCKNADTGMANGTCVPNAVKATNNLGKLDAGACDDTNGPAALCMGKKCACDQAGECKLQPGQVGSAVGDCVTGFFKDTRCCKTACTVACGSCNNATGDCQAVMGMADAPECTGTVGCPSMMNCVCNAAGDACVP